MSNSPRAATAPETTKPLSTGKVVSYAIGDVANNLSFQMTSMFLLVYVTDIAGLSAAVAASIYGLTKIWAGITDLVAGNSVDRVNTRWGHLRPWIVGVSPFLAVALVGLFSTPAGLSGTTAVAWIFLFDAFFQLCYSFVNIPYGSLSAAMTENSVDRSRLAGARSIASAATGVVLAIVLSPQFKNTQADGIRLKFTITTLVMALLALALYWVCFLNTREVVPRSPGKVNLKSTLKMVGHNRPLLMLCFGALFMLGAMFTMTAVQMYFAKAVLGGANNFIWLQIASTVGTILSASLVPAITVRFGKRLGYVGLAVVAMLAFAVIGLVPNGSKGLWVALGGWFLYGIGTGGTNALMFSMQADTVDYGEWQSGTRAEGGAYSILSFVRKCGQGIGGALGGVIIGAFGYQGHAKVQTAHALTGIHVAAGWFPMLCTVAAATIMLLLYPLKPEQHAEIVQELSQRRAARSGGVAPATGAAIPAVQHPVVTINESYGAGAAEVATLLAERLGVPCVGNRFSSEELESAEHTAGDLALSDSATTRFLASLGATGVDADRTIAANAEADHKMVVDNTTELAGLGSTGAVVVGRDATVVLAGVPGVLHVRIDAPRETRVNRASIIYQITPEVAAERLEREDRMRREMSQRLMGWDPTDASRYDVVIDGGTTGRDEAVEQLVQAYRSRFPEVR